MPEGRLVIGTRRYSSWSLRGWLPVRLAGLDVEEVVIPLEGSGATPAVLAVSPSGLVPFLEHRGARLWESIAIAEYCAEFAPGLWPTDRAARARARSIAAEMHAGFRDLRQAMPMNLFRAGEGTGRTPGALADIGRIEFDLAGRPGGIGRAVPVRRRFRQCRCDVCTGGVPVPHLPPRHFAGGACLLRCGAGTSPGEHMVRPRRAGAGGMAAGEIRGPGMTGRAALQAPAWQICPCPAPVVDAGGGAPQQGAEETICCPFQAPAFFQPSLTFCSSSLSFGSDRAA